MEMDLKVDEYLTGEKHQLGRHVTMLVIMLFTIIVVSTLAVQPANTAISPRCTFLAPRDGPGEILQRFYVISFWISVVEAQASFPPLASDTSGSVHVLSGEEQGQKMYLQARNCSVGI